MQAQVPARKRQNDLIPSGTVPQQDQKKHKYEGSSCTAPASIGMTTLDAIVDCLFGQESLQDIAVEFRAGKLWGRDKRFIPTLTEPDFQVIYGQVKRQCKVTCETDYSYDQGRFNMSRLSVNEEGVVTSALHTEHIGSFDMETNLPFDIRVNIARDTPITPLPATIDDDYCKKKTKTRFTIDAKDWVVALTESTSNDENLAYELVVEVKLSSIATCADHRACASLLGSVFVEVHNMLARLSSEGAQIFPDLKLERVTSPQLRQHLKCEFMKLVPGVHNQDRFPGSQPCALERNKIKILQTGKYWVSEKSDGLRLMLFFLDGCAYFVDRKLDFFQLHKFTFIVDLFGRKGPSLLDGEMVRHLRTGKLMYLLFDILALNGKTNLGAYGLLDRLGIITKQVVEVFRVACKACNMKDDSSRLQFSLAGKIFRNKSGVGLLAEMIKMQDSGERLFVDERRCHRNDGLIFTLDGPYLPYSSSHLMKWKYADRLTIDFRFKILPDGRHSFTVGAGRNKETEIRDFDMSPENLEKLTADLKKTRNHKEAIIECTFDAARSQWCYQNLRPDKDLPNHFNTMENTKRIVIDNITMEELVYRVSRVPQEDDWEKLHPELFKQPFDSQVVPDKSPNVDLPATPVESPIPYLSPSQSQQSPPPHTPTPMTPVKTVTPLRTSTQQIVNSPPTQQVVPVPMTICENLEISDMSIFTFMPTSFPNDPSSTYDDQSHSLLCGPPPPLFCGDHLSAHLSPPTSPSAFFS